ncbi:MAG: trypsin-like peptidase domain-containing protein [Oscillospiraceae bacterium]|nr:trypsin-like peptidase domain-containing protein [Oscillospiraceae bacterium]
MEETRYTPDPREVVHSYTAPEPESVVLCYVAPTPLPGKRRTAQQPPRAQERPRKRKGRRGRVALIVLAIALAVGLRVLAVMQAADSVRFFFYHAGGEPFIYGDFDPEDFVPQLEQKKRETTIPRHDAGGTARLRFTREHGLSMSARQIYEKVNRSTVTVIGNIDSKASVGTGVIFSGDGYIITNEHVISGAESCTVILWNGESHSAKFVGGEAEKDVAVLKIDASGLDAAEFGDSDSLVVGDTVYAIGNPLGIELRGTMTDGIVSAIGRSLGASSEVEMELIQTNAALNSGNSGGPLINVYGQVVGINTLKMSGNGFGDIASIEGLGFALPISAIAYMINDIVALGQVLPEPVLGMSVLIAGERLEDGRVGFMVEKVEKKSNAASAGVQVGDFVVSVDGTKMTSTGDLIYARRCHERGELLRLEIFRGGEYLFIDVPIK